VRRFEGKAALITGGASGIGRASAMRLASEGASIVVADIDGEGAGEAAAAVAALGASAVGVRTDVADFAAVCAAVDETVARYGRIDVVVNSAGTSVHRPLLEHEPADFDLVVRTNQYGTYHGILAASRRMAALGIHGTIINMSSVFAYTASPGLIGYHAAKGAVRAMTQAAALELARFGIRVVAVAPGAVDTPFIQGYRDAGLERHLARRHMRGRILDPDQVAGVIAFLATPDADAVNGTVVMADDGYVAFK
jgi:glucose 1-dehydrogenase